MMRSPILMIDGSRDPVSVAVLVDGAVVASRQVFSRDPQTGIRREVLTPAVAECLVEASLAAGGLSAIICSRGPGGFTSLRSAAALAKGMCSALGIPLYTVSTFELIAADRATRDELYLALLDAGRKEVHAGFVHVFNHRNDIGPTELLPLGSREDAYRLAMDRGATVLDGDFYDPTDTPRASAITTLLYRVLSGGPVDMDRWEPFYGRLPEAQVKWEHKHGTSLSAHLQQHDAPAS